MDKTDKETKNPTAKKPVRNTTETAAERELLTVAFLVVAKRNLSKAINHGVFKASAVYDMHAAADQLRSALVTLDPGGRIRQILTDLQAG